MNINQRKNKLDTDIKSHIPLISIVMPTYKRASGLRETIDSVLKQSFTDWELIIVNDNDPQSAYVNQTEAIIREFQQNFSIHHVKHEKNKGACAARNTGVLAAKGEFIAFLDDDDVWREDKLELQMCKMENQNVGFCFCDLIYVDLASGDRKLVNFGFCDDDFFMQLFKKGTGICTSALLIRKKLLLEIGGFDTSLPSYQDFDLLLRLSMKSKHAYIDTPLLDWNVSSDGISRNYEAKFIGQKTILEKYVVQYSAKNVTRYYARQCGILGDFAVLSGRRWYAVGAYLRSLCRDPTLLSIYAKLVITFLGGRILYQVISNLRQKMRKMLSVVKS